MSHKIPPLSVPMGFACCAVAANSMTAWPGCMAVSEKPISLATGGGESSPRHICCTLSARVDMMHCLLYGAGVPARQASACIARATIIAYTTAVPAAGPIASDVRFKKRVLGSLAIHFALIPVFPQSEKARCLLEKDTKS